MIVSNGKFINLKKGFSMTYLYSDNNLNFNIKNLLASKEFQELTELKKDFVNEELKAKLEELKNNIPKITLDPSLNIYTKATANPVKITPLFNQKTRKNPVTLKRVVFAAGVALVVGMGLARNNRLNAEFETCKSKFSPSDCEQFGKSRMEDPIYNSWTQCNSVENSTVTCNQFLETVVWKNTNIKPNCMGGGLRRLFQNCNPKMELVKEPRPAYWNEDLYKDWKQCTQQCSQDSCSKYISVSQNGPTPQSAVWLPKLLTVGADYPGFGKWTGNLC